MGIFCGCVVRGGRGCMGVCRYLLQELGFVADMNLDEEESGWGTQSIFFLRRPGGARPLTIVLMRYHTVGQATRYSLAHALAVPEENSVAPNLRRVCVLSAPVRGPDGEDINEVLNARIAATQVGCPGGMPCACRLHPPSYEWHLAWLCAHTVKYSTGAGRAEGAHCCPPGAWVVGSVGGGARSVRRHVWGAAPLTPASVAVSPGARCAAADIHHPHPPTHPPPRIRPVGMANGQRRKKRLAPKRAEGQQPTGDAGGRGPADQRVLHGPVGHVGLCCGTSRPPARMAVDRRAMRARHPLSLDE